MELHSRASDIGAIAGKSVMEGKSVLFKNFAGIDVFDIELNTKTRMNLYVP